MLLQQNKPNYVCFFKPREMPAILTQPRGIFESDSFSLLAKESGYITLKQLEAARQTIRRKVKREGKLEILVFPNIAITRKASAARMGKGKGKVDHLVAAVSAGQRILKLYGIDTEQAMPALKSGAKKLPISTHITAH